MSSILDMLGQLTGPQLPEVSRQVGADQPTTQRALTAAVPLLVSALARNSSQPSGAQALHQALAKDHDGQVLDNTGEYVKNPNLGDGSAILGHALGQQRGAVEQAVAQHTGLDTQQAGKLLAMVAPLVMGYLGRQQRQQGLDPGGLASLLQNQQQTAQSAAPDLLSSLAGMLGGGGGGSTGDLGSALGNLLGRR